MKRDSVLNTISSENNRLILLNLLDGKKTPTMLTKTLDMSYQDLSNRLKILLKHDLIKKEPTPGREIYYSRNEEMIVKLKSYFDYSLGLNLNSLKEYHENASKWDDGE